MIICLTGFMGCGKSSVGRRLSQLLCCPFMDLDDVIVEDAGRSIPEIFASEGEAGFRRMELEALMGILSTSESRQCAPLAPSHFVGPSPTCYRRLFAAKVHWTICKPLTRVRKCQFRTNALTPIEYLDCHPEASSCHPERSEGSINLVLALGGGTVMIPECAQIVKEQTFCVYLRASAETLLEHLSGEADGRPMLNGETLYERITVLMAQRSETYEKTAHVIIDTDGKSIEAVASEIVSMLNI